LAFIIAAALRVDHNTCQCRVDSSFDLPTQRTGLK